MDVGVVSKGCKATCSGRVSLWLPLLKFNSPEHRLGSSIGRGITRILPLVAAAAAAAVLAGTAWASYWDFSGYLSRYDSYYEGTSSNQFWDFRLSRQYCGTKMQVYPVGGGVYRIPIPGGCDNNDYETTFTQEIAAECYNADGPRMWVNCRIALT